MDRPYTYMGVCLQNKKHVLAGRNFDNSAYRYRFASTFFKYQSQTKENENKDSIYHHIIIE
jgi:hypothetical protein